MAQSLGKKIINRPSVMIVITFAVTIFVGTLLLLLPISTKSGISFINALFTSTSAVCVTGLAVHDTGTYFTTFGQCVILALIQIGGLGILTLSIFFIAIFTGRVGFAERNLVEESLTQDHIGNFYHFLKRVFIFVATLETLGVLLLFIGFVQNHTLSQAIFLSLFHSVSAFCNAGFSLFSHSLVQYRANVYINLVIMALIILGGVGFIVFEDVRFRVIKKTKKLSFHTKVVLAGSLLLIIAGAVFIFCIEDHRAFSKFSFAEKIIAACFQSVTCRTAGFNTVDMTTLSNASLFLCIVLMFIGGSPGSTAGGIKTTSFCLFIALLISRLRRRPHPELFHRTVSNQTVERVLTLGIISILIVVVALFALLVMEADNSQLQKNPRPFLTMLFEIVSAFGTAGLSMGFTPFLSFGGKCIIVLLMFIGRVGPLTFVLLMIREQQQLDFKYPEEEIMVG